MMYSLGLNTVKYQTAPRTAPLDEESSIMSSITSISTASSHFRSESDSSSRSGNSDLKKNCVAFSQPGSPRSVAIMKRANRPMKATTARITATPKTSRTAIVVTPPRVRPTQENEIKNGSSHSWAEQRLPVVTPTPKFSPKRYGITQKPKGSPKKNGVAHPQPQQKQSKNIASLNLPQIRMPTTASWGELHQLKNRGNDVNTHVQKANNKPFRNNVFRYNDEDKNNTENANAKSSKNNRVTRIRMRNNNSNVTSNSDHCKSESSHVNNEKHTFKPTHLGHSRSFDQADVSGTTNDHQNQQHGGFGAQFSHLKVARTSRELQHRARVLVHHAISPATVDVAFTPNTLRRGGKRRHKNQQMREKEENENSAAVVIQRRWRGLCTRGEYNHRKISLNQARMATKIQSKWRVVVSKHLLAVKKINRDYGDKGRSSSALVLYATKIQAMLRGYLQRIDYKVQLLVRQCDSIESQKNDELSKIRIDTNTNKILIYEDERNRLYSTEAIKKSKEIASQLNSEALHLSQEMEQLRKDSCLMQESLEKQYDKQLSQQFVNKSKILECNNILFALERLIEIQQSYKERKDSLEESLLCMDKRIEKVRIENEIIKRCTDEIIELRNANESKFSSAPLTKRKSRHQLF